MTEPDWTKNHARPNVAAGVLFTDEQDRILMVEPTYKDYLDIPGGYVEKGETPYEAAQREVFEELGIQPQIGRLLVADWWSDSPETDLGAKLVFIFDGSKLNSDQVNSVRVDGREIVSIKFHRLDELEEVTIPRLASRVRIAAASCSEGRVRYLENGDMPAAN